MKLRIATVLLALIVAFGMLSCGDSGLSNDPVVAAAILSQASYANQSLTQNLAAKLVTGGTGDLSGSVFKDNFSTATILAITFTDEPVEYGGKTYTLNGTINYAFDFSSYPTNMSALVYAPGFSISGPDFDGSFDCDLEETITVVDYSNNTITMDLTLNGTIGGQTFDDRKITIGFYFSPPV